MFEFIYTLLLIFLFISILGYILVVIREKLLLKNNIILIDNKHVKQEDLEKTDTTVIIFSGNKVKSGDEVKVITKENEKYHGLVIGIKRSDRSIHIISHTNQIIICKLDNIQKFKIISKYGKFLN